MKHLKTKIKLSVLALACLGAGALALQPTAYAKADDQVDYAACLTMANGASVCVRDDFSGIRWMTTIDAAKYAELEEANEGAEISFGTLVMPTSQLGEDGVLTEADKDAINIVANVDLENDTKYYSIINYDNIAESYTGELTTEEALQKAYALELTARSYVKVDDTYYFTDMTGISTSRSARQVALAAELAGDLDKMGTEKANKAAGYYSKDGRYTEYEVNTGKAGTEYIDLSALATERQTVKIYVDLGIDDYDSSEGDTGLEVMIGAQKMTDVILYTAAKPAVEPDEAAGIEGSAAVKARLAFHVPKGTVLPTGEHYVSVFLPNGSIKTIPFICATKVITKAEELAIFSAKGGYDQYSSKASAWVDDKDTEDTSDDVDLGYWRESQVQSGYYVLGKNIDASKYVHGSRYAEDVATVIPETSVAGKDGELGTDDDIKPGDFNNATWNGYDWYVGKPIGLTGTFNGMGFTIDSMTIGSQREGFFGLVNGGTVKNVAFDNVKATGSYNFIIANYLINATISDLYIATNTYNKDDKVNNPGYAFNKGTGIFASYAVEDTKISNIFIRLNSSLSSTPTLSTFGALFGGTNANEDYTCKNVFVYCRQHVKYIVGTTTTVTDEATGETTEKTTYASATVQYYMPMVTEAVAKVAKDDNSEYTILSSKGTLYVAENQVKDPNAAKLEAYSPSISTDVYNLVVIKGVYTYPQSDKGHVSGTWADHDYSAFWASGCWGTGTRGVAWKTL